MLDQPTGNMASANSAVLVSLDFSNGGHAESLNELRQLAASDALEISAVVNGKRTRPDPALFAGTGKIDEIALVLEHTGAPLVIFNHELTPAQQRNLEQRLGCRVIDRTSLILDIFAQRAKSHEGKLQVELAQLEHLATRLCHLAGKHDDIPEQAFEMVGTIEDVIKKAQDLAKKVAA